MPLHNSGDIRKKRVRALVRTENLIWSFRGEIGMPVLLKDANGNYSELVPSSIGIGIGVTQVGKEFEVAGNVISRMADAGLTAVAMAAEEDGLGSVWANQSYDPVNPFSGWKRTIN